MDKIFFAGYLGSDPEMKYMPSGDAVTNFSVGVDRSYTDRDGERVKQTIWYRVAAWKKLGENCNKYLSKGSFVIVEGQMQEPRVWTNNDGETLPAGLEVRASNVTFGPRTNSSGSAAEADDEPLFNEKSASNGAKPPWEK